MQGINRVTLLGNIGDDPVSNQTKSGKIVTNVRLATSKKDRDGNQITEWHDLVFWDKLGEIAGDWLAKGMKIYVEGAIKTDKYPDKDGGPDRYKTKINVTELRMLDRRDDNQGGEQQQRRAQPQQNRQQQAPRQHGNQNNGGYQQRNQGQQRQRNAPPPQRGGDDLPDDYDYVPF